MSREGNESFDHSEGKGPVMVFGRVEDTADSFQKDQMFLLTLDGERVRLTPGPEVHGVLDLSGKRVAVLGVFENSNPEQLTLVVLGYRVLPGGPNPETDGAGGSRRFLPKKKAA